jgi:hypothetical protein
MLKGQKSFRSSILATVAFVFLFGASTAFAQVDVTGSTGADGSYATLSAAFTAINGGVHTGNNIVIGISGDTTEPTVPLAASAVLNAGAWTTITISPTGGAGRTISGAATAGFPMIDLNGADNVTIDGLNTGGNSLTIANTTVSATSITSTIRFIGGAANNSITNSNIQGSGTMSVATNGAVIFFSTDTVSGAGNDNNTISNNNIGPAGANLPTKGILCNGSTGTTAVGNSGLVINNNNIFDYFGAAVTSAGLAVNGGCNALSITNNRFYQTGTRTWTTGAEHNAILMNSTSSVSGVQGMTITGNIVGYSSSTQTGVYTLTGSTGIFRGIRYNGIVSGTASNINNNTIAAVSLTGVTSSGTSTLSPFAAMLFNEGTLVSSGNTIGSQSATGSMIFSTTSTTATDVYGIYNFSSNIWTSNTNSIGGISVTNAAASGTYVIYGLRANTGTTVAWTATGNNVGGTIANSIQLTATGTASQVIGLHTSNAPAVFTSNTVRNLTTNIGTGTTTGASVIGINVTTTTPNHTLSQNTIHTLTNTNASAASIVTGIQFTGSTANVVERNFIYNLLAPTVASGAEINGIRIAGGTTQYRNNMIALGANQAIASGAFASNTGTNGINGILEALGTNQFFHNSVYIGGTATSGSGASYAFNGTQTGSTRSNRDNIFFNARTNSGATGTHYAIKYNGIAVNPAGLTVNNNVYFVNGTGGVFGYYNSADRANLAAWQAAVGQDAGSFFSNPQFNDPTNAVPDLHLHPTNPTVAEGNGVDVGVVLDFDGQTRSGLTPVDIGADAGNFVGIDLAGPTITYTPFLNTSSTSTRTLNVTITDNSGVASGGLAPRIYQRKTPPGGSYSSLTCTGTSPNYTCDIDTAIIGTPAVADVIEYFIVAQDTVGNVSVSPSAGAVATDVLTVTTPPTTPSSYTIVGSVSGTLTADGVGGGAPNFASLTNAAGVFEYINNNEVTGNIVIEISADLTGENGGVALNEFASPHTILIKPVGGPRTITGSSTTSIIKLNGADRVRIDGSTAATFADSVIGGTPGLRELTVSNTNTGGTTSVFWIGTNASSGANNNIIRNLNMIGAGTPAAPSGQGVIAGSGATFGGGAENGRPNSNNTIRNTTARGVQNAVFTVGDAITLDQNWVVAENDFGSTVATEKLTFRGVAIQNAQNFTITENIISGISSSTATSATMSGILVGATLNGGVITKNQIRDIRQNNAVGWGSNGVFLNSTSAASGVVVANNFISDIASQGFNGFDQGDNGYGIMVNSGGGYSIYYNSVLMNANQVAAGGHSSALNVEDVIPAGGLDVRNNIFVSNQTVGNRYAVIHQGPTAAAYAFIDNNDYYSPSGTFNIGRLNGVNQTTLAGWQGVTGSDLNSISFDPLFTSATDLRTLFGTPVQDKGVAVSVLDDIDGNIRSVVGFTEGKSNLSGGIPDMGAKERLGPTSSAASVGGRVVTASGQGIRGAAIVVSGNSLPTPIIVKTGSLGYYQVDGLQTGETYVLTVVSKRFTFAQPSRVINLADNINDVDFMANPLE